MGEITAISPLGQSITQCVKDLDLRINLEIGSWDGTGATRCFIDAMKDFREKSLTCLEIDKKKFDDLVKNVKEYPWVKCYNRSSIDCNKLIDFGFDRIWKSPFNTLAHTNHKEEMIHQWYNTDVQVMKKHPHGFLEEDTTIYDSVLIDGGEFTGYFEFELLKDRTNVFFLDDSYRAYKTKKVSLILLEDLEWEHVASGHQREWNSQLRNGFDVFKRKEFIKHKR